MTTKSVLVTGASGMLGHRIARHLSRRRPVVAQMRRATRPERLRRILSGVDVVETNSLDDTSIGALLDRYRPQVVINAAGLIKQRPAASDPRAMIEANGLLPHRLAAQSRQRGIRLIHVSSDCVFSGDRGNYAEHDRADADDLYGRTKLIGEPCEKGCLTLRTSIIGPEIGTAYGLVEWFKTREGKTASGFRQVIFPGLPTIRFAMLVEDIIDRFPDLDGLYHVGATPIAKHDLLELINERYRLKVTLQPTDVPVSDRSLDCSRFRKVTGFEGEPWPDLIDIMAKDEEDERRGA